MLQIILAIDMSDHMDKSHLKSSYDVTGKTAQTYTTNLNGRILF